jgi:hypothetical protein
MARFDVRVDCKQPRSQVARLFRMANHVLHFVDISASFLAEYGGCYQALDAVTYQTSFPGRNGCGKKGSYKTMVS